eukprot:TRINITY_DN49984_c0_g1_i1.p1 TRINITY_DN49984_c0_g1~~TRINITY_DN49984_c0_g1_i1.p1  ORF type:complete len:253 (+),score=81.09 TRINITY_DN49984_c0_g1_i1:87-761(+)
MSGHSERKRRRRGEEQKPASPAAAPAAAPADAAAAAPEAPFWAKINGHRAALPETGKAEVSVKELLYGTTAHALQYVKGPHSELKGTLILPDPNGLVTLLHQSYYKSVSLLEPKTGKGKSAPAEGAARAPRGVSGYNLFVAQCRVDAAKKGTKIAFSDAGRMWGQLSEDDRRAWNEKAKAQAAVKLEPASDADQPPAQPPQPAQSQPPAKKRRSGKNKGGAPGQ